MRLSSSTRANHKHNTSSSSTTLNHALHQSFKACDISKELFYTTTSIAFTINCIEGNGKPGSGLKWRGRLRSRDDFTVTLLMPLMLSIFQDYIGIDDSVISFSFIIS
uniref:Exonuclease n=1 Tax=uncultured marine virus TaxID=186617 RepID=A0A0F7LBV8_9VIRU|nr:exonuclease [uncultured marine virus]